MSQTEVAQAQVKRALTEAKGNVKGHANLSKGKVGVMGNSLSVKRSFLATIQAPC